MSTVLIGVIAIAIPVVLFGVVFVVYRIAEATRVSRTARLAIAVPASEASFALAVAHVRSGGVLWIPVVTMAMWAWVVVLGLRESNA
jgi:hypothetical protein